MSELPELEEKLADVEYRLADIKGQLEQANAHQIETGEYADADWYRRAKAAQRYAGIEHQHLQREIAEIKRAKRATGARVFETHFMEAARDMLAPEEFKMIFKAAHDRSQV